MEVGRRMVGGDGRWDGAVDGMRGWEVGERREEAVGRWEEVGEAGECKEDRG